MTDRRRLGAFLLAAAAYVLAATLPWHPQDSVRRAAGLVAATLVLWIAEIAPLGVVALAIPIAATFTGLLPWKDALAAWSDPVVFLFLGAFLLARALDKHGVFDWLLRIRWSRDEKTSSGLGQVLVILVIAGTLSTLQNNTAVAAMMLPITLALARRAKAPYAVLLALAWGSTFGGMATPVGTAPNFIGFAAIKKIDPTFTFLSWFRVGLPLWLGTTLIGWAVLAAAMRRTRRLVAMLAASRAEGWMDQFVVTDVGPVHEAPPSIPSVAAIPSTFPKKGEREGSTQARNWALAGFGVAALLWLVPGLVVSMTDENHPAAIFFRQYLPESLVPLVVAWVMFFIHVGPEKRPLLDRHDFQALDWDTLFLIAGGLSLGKVLEISGAAAALAQFVAGAHLSPIVFMLALAGTTVLLSELTSNTATASLMVPIAASIAQGAGFAPAQAIWLVALAASLGFALPVSTPPNAIVYGTRLIPLRLMVVTGIVVDILSTFWLVACISFFGG